MHAADQNINIYVYMYVCIDIIQCNYMHRESVNDCASLSYNNVTTIYL